jgi:hypothetical protein
VTTRFRVFDGAEVGSCDLKCLGSRIDFFLGSLEVNKGEKKNIDPTSMHVVDPIIGMNLSSSQIELV